MDALGLREIILIQPGLCVEDGEAVVWHSELGRPVTSTVFTVLW